MKSKKP